MVPVIMETTWEIYGIYRILWHRVRNIFVDVVGDGVEDWKLEPSMGCFCKMSFP